MEYGRKIPRNVLFMKGAACAGAAVTFGDAGQGKASGMGLVSRVGQLSGEAKAVNLSR